MKLVRDDLATQLRGKSALTVTIKRAVSETIATDQGQFARIAELTHANSILAAALKERA